MTDVLLRTGVGFMGGALLRMLEVFGVPFAYTIPGFLLFGGLLSYRSDLARLFVVLAVSTGHFIASQMTAVPAGPATDNPEASTLAWNAMQLFLPWALPPLGAILSLRWEKQKEGADSRALPEEEHELTEERLLAERLPYQTGMVVDTEPDAAALKVPYEPPSLEELDRLEEMERRVARLGAASGPAQPLK